MGMSASQMRYCMIAGKKSDVEFQGQQINQQRTTLATESSSYNTQLLSMSVPTPPSTSDYTKTAYTFTLGSNNCSVTGSKYDSDDGTYTVNYSYSTTGEAAATKQSTFFKSVNPTTKSVIYSTGSTSDTATTLTEVSDSDSKYTTLAASLKTIYGDNYNATSYKLTSDNTVKLNKLSTANATNSSILEKIYGTNYNSSKNYYAYNTTDAATGKAVTNYISSEDIASSVANGNTTAKSYVLNSDGSASGTAGIGITASTESYFYYKSGSTYQFVKGSELANINDNDSKTLTSSFVNENATIQESGTLTNANVTWSETGRMNQISVTTDGVTNTYDLTTATSTNEDAYTDAYNEYQYQKQEYDQEMNKINAQICVIQNQDKKLELKLQDLDTQQQALSTEMESVKKVIDKNIESSFKAFSA